MTNTYAVEVTRTVDGDTFFGNLIVSDFNMVFTNQKFRFLGVNTPERGQNGYYEAKEFVAQTCDGKTLKVDLHGKDSFGRWLINVFYEDGKSLNEELLKLGLAVVFH
jgi:endonuclease YncB( thermonuclease family)